MEKLKNLLTVFVTFLIMSLIISLPALACPADGSECKDCIASRMKSDCPACAPIMRCMAQCLWDKGMSQKQCVKKCDCDGGYPRRFGSRELRRLSTLRPGSGLLCRRVSLICRISSTLLSKGKRYGIKGMKHWMRLVMKMKTIWENCVELLGGFLGGDDEVQLRIQEQVELACRCVGVDRSSPEFKRCLMIRLRETFDAGLCKSKWGKAAHLQPGDYEYIDVNVAGTRYIVEVSIATEFELARSTTRYASLLKILPPIFVGKIETLEHIVKLMCRAIKKSLKKSELHVPPWRRYVYMHAKWFTSSYKRTIKEFPELKGSDSDSISEKKRTVGFVPNAVTNRSYFCREACGSKGGSRVGKLAMLLK
ncbi:hypothetical protein ACET3Z_001940 [Daucus carota]